MSISKGAKGAAGVNFVAAELSMLGKVALPTTRNVKGPDIVVFDQETLKTAFVQVRSSDKTKYGWLCGRIDDDSTDWEGKFRRAAVRSKNYFYVFVALPADEKSRPSYYVVPAAKVADSAIADTKLWLKKHPKAKAARQMLVWAYFDKNGELKGKYLNRWDVLKLEKD
jgi:hypothetical protein